MKQVRNDEERISSGIEEKRDNSIDILCPIPFYIAH